MYAFSLCRVRIAGVPVSDIVAALQQYARYYDLCLDILIDTKQIDAPKSAGVFIYKLYAMRKYMHYQQNERNEWNKCAFLEMIDVPDVLTWYETHRELDEKFEFPRKDPTNWRKREVNKTVKYEYLQHSEDIEDMPFIYSDPIKFHDHIETQFEASFTPFNGFDMTPPVAGNPSLPNNASVNNNSNVSVHNSNDKVNGNGNGNGNDNGNGVDKADMDIAMQLNVDKKSNDEKVDVNGNDNQKSHDENKSPHRSDDKVKLNGDKKSNDPKDELMSDNNGDKRSDDNDESSNKNENAATKVKTTAMDANLQNKNKIKSREETQKTENVVQLNNNANENANAKITKLNKKKNEKTNENVNGANQSSINNTNNKSKDTPNVPKTQRKEQSLSLTVSVSAPPIKRSPSRVTTTSSVEVQNGSVDTKANERSPSRATTTSQNGSVDPNINNASPPNRVFRSNERVSKLSVQLPRLPDLPKLPPLTPISRLKEKSPSSGKDKSTSSEPSKTDHNDCKSSKDDSTESKDSSSHNGNGNDNGTRKAGKNNTKVNDNAKSNGNGNGKSNGNNKKRSKSTKNSGSQQNNRKRSKSRSKSRIDPGGIQMPNKFYNLSNKNVAIVSVMGTKLHKKLLQPEFCQLWQRNGESGVPPPIAQFDQLTCLAQNGKMKTVSGRTPIYLRDNNSPRKQYYVKSYGSLSPIRDGLWVVKDPTQKQTKTKDSKQNEKKYSSFNFSLLERARE